ncbi:hypothetical protein K2F40_07400 [Clostridium sp. CM028]|nr:hypothetical protein [Clostridium sp. CM028]MBW9148784.1 hypothetical protein [Clostridium sp. CM028]WLC63112.1 hypothetical protein KTC94_07665 [Clostridium sp. CM028]
MSEVLRLSNISKVYGNQKVLDKVGLSINEGEIIGLVGNHYISYSNLHYN